MTINLDTGSAVRLSKNSTGLTGDFVGKAIVTDDTTPSEPIIYPSVEKEYIIVEPNKMVILTGYNFSSSTKVKFLKLLRSNGVPATGSNDCCPTINLSNSIILHRVQLPCWEMNGCNPLFVLKTPGMYEIEVINPDVDTVVTASSYIMQEVNTLTECGCVETPPVINYPPVLDPVLPE